MQIIPAIDIKNGQCVRLRQGKMDQVTVFEADPVKAAARWVAEGAQRLHIVDLDGAIAGEAVNLKIIHKIITNYPNLDVQVGGGIRNATTVNDYFAIGVSYQILGTQAVKDPSFIKKMCSLYPHKIILGLDAKEGKVSIDGWTNTSSHIIATEFIQQFKHQALAAVVYTDISRDGMLSGVNTHSLSEMANLTSLPIIASGGISNLADIKKLIALKNKNIIGAITGRAIYENTLNLKDAIKLCHNK